MLLPIIILLLCLVGGGAVLFYLKTSKPQRKEQADLAAQTAQQFVNVHDIRGNFLYTQDGYLLCYLRIYPISLDLLSPSEKRLLINKLTAELSSVRFPFKFWDRSYGYPLPSNGGIGEISSNMLLPCIT